MLAIQRVLHQPFNLSYGTQSVPHLLFLFLQQPQGKAQSCQNPYSTSFLEMISFTGPYHHLFWVVVQNDWVGLLKGFILTPEYEAKVKDLLFHLLPVSERIEGSLFDIYTSSPEIFNSSKNVNYPFENIIIPTLVISARDDPLALHKNANTLVERIPNSRLLALPDGGHLFLGHDKEVMVEITNFLDINMTK